MSDQDAKRAGGDANREGLAGGQAAAGGAAEDALERTPATARLPAPVAPGGAAPGARAREDGKTGRREGREEREGRGAPRGYRVIRDLSTGPDRERLLARRVSDDVRVELERYPALNSAEAAAAREDIARWRAAGGNAAHVDAIIDARLTGGELSIVRSADRGVPLERRIREEGGLSPDGAVALVLGLCDSLRLLARRNLFHGAISPAAVIFRAGKAVLTDGFCRPVGRERLSLFDKHGLGFHPPFYTAPECQTAPAKKSAARDVYALGCLLFRLLEGRPPFTAPTAFEVMALHAEAPVPRLAAPGLVPVARAAAQGLIEAMLRKRAGERLVNYDDLYARLVGLHRLILEARDPAAAATPVATRDRIDDFLARHPSPRRRRRRRRFRALARRLPAALAGGLVLALAAVGAHRWALGTGGRAGGESPVRAASPSPGAAVAAEKYDGAVARRLAEERLRAALDRFAFQGDAAGARAALAAFAREHPEWAAALDASGRLEEIDRHAAAEARRGRRHALESAAALTDAGETALAWAALEPLGGADGSRPDEEVAAARAGIESAAAQRRDDTLREADRLAAAAAGAGAAREAGARPDYPAALERLTAEQERTLPALRPALAARAREIAATMDAAAEAAATSRKEAESPAPAGAAPTDPRGFITEVAEHVRRGRYVEAKRLTASANLGGREADRRARFLYFWIVLEERLFAGPGAGPGPGAGAAGSAAGERTRPARRSVIASDIFPPGHPLAAERNLVVSRVGTDALTLRDPRTGAERVVPLADVPDPTLYDALRGLADADSDDAALGLFAFARFRGLTARAESARADVIRLDPANAEKLAEFDAALNFLRSGK
ncbi:MAG: hypothetical protein HY719_05040 [Planctomycetes bacterium]|nr:hypothetical protein [Planctomycetota bacterium]